MYVTTCVYVLRSPSGEIQMDYGFNIYSTPSVNPVPHAQVCVYLKINITKLHYKLHFQNLSIYHIAGFFLGEFIFMFST
jgi:hypothetical protein